MQNKMRHWTQKFTWFGQNDLRPRPKGETIFTNLEKLYKSTNQA